MADPALKMDDRFTYGQYRRWNDDQRWELIDGEAWAMSSPSEWHQILFVRLVLAFGNFLEGKPCRLMAAPFDVLFPKRDEEDDEVDTVLQPDLLVFCDRSKLRSPNARGAPDLVVEILSPSTQRKDLNEKFRVYERAGVCEYWVVDPFARSLCLYRPGAPGRFDRGELHERSDRPERVESRVLEGFSIDMQKLFAEPA
ncbi:MAG: Uma2 family endonuclease [Spirochaetota bacterium]